MDKTMVEQEIILRRKLDLLLRTGKILVESAADTNRIVRNMNRVAAYLGLPEENLHIDVTYTMLVVNLSDESHSYSKFQKCEKHGINMTAISEISKLSWRAIEEDYSLDRYEEELEKIKNKKRNYTPRLAELNGATATEIKMKYAGLDIKAGKKEPLLIQAFRSFFAIITDLLNVQKLYASGVVSGVYETITTPELIEARDDLYQSEWLEVTVSRNLPQNNKEIADIVAELADIVPDSYLYELLWFIDDPQKALEEMRAQKEESQQTSLTNSLAAIGYGADNLGDTGGDPDNPDDQQNSVTGSTITQPPE